MDIREIDNSLHQIFMNLALAYEAEFSKITNKKPNTDGTFELDIELGENVKGFLLFIQELPAGFVVISQNASNDFEVCEFYILPFFRRKHLGKQFICKIFDMYKGQWQVKQIENADYAVSFWRQVISEYTNNSYTETQCLDSYWGKVTKQVFASKIKTS